MGRRKKKTLAGWMWARSKKTKQITPPQICFHSFGLCLSIPINLNARRASFIYYIFFLFVFKMFCFRLTAPSLHIHKTIISTLFFPFYLEVNGCQETNEAARNSCTSTLQCDAEGGKHRRSTPRGGRNIVSRAHKHTRT